MPEINKLGIDDLKEEIKRLLDLSPQEWIKASDDLSHFANEVNKTFGQGRQRMIELNQSIADAVPNVNRLGGNIGDVSKTLNDVALASRRNVVANSEEVEKLYAASKLLGTGVEELSNAFINVGVGIEAIPDQLEKSMEYVRSIGGNTKQVFADVQNNMDQMNRYQFEGGVVGLTKMAAQASMLRFNMNETFRLADRVLDPDGAVETAAAFQRLGVAAGNLADPFQLMNQSINDPSGLQNSLADVAKQFTYFDEKTKSFKINPQGVLTLREMEKQTGVLASEMSKMGLAAAELDKRISAVNAAGLKITDEEDKQFLANIAKFDTKTGKYMVTLEDGTKKELAELQQSDFDELIKQQKEGPKTMEELQRATLNASEILVNDVSAIRNKISLGFLSAKPVVSTKEQLRSITEATLGGYSKMGTTGDVRKEFTTFAENFQKAYKDLEQGKGGKESLITLLNQAGDQLESIKTKLINSFVETTKQIGEKESKKKGDIEKEYGNFLLMGAQKMEQSTKPTTSGASSTPDKTALEKATKVEYGVNSNKTEVIVGGKFTVEVILPNNFNQLDKEQQQKTLDAIFNSQQFKQQVADIATRQNATKAPVSTNFGNK